MRMRTKSLLFCCAALILLFHFSLLCIYALPKQGKKTRLEYWSQYYSYPYFEQSWILFAPAPEENYNLFVEYEYLGRQKQDLIFEILDDFKNNAFQGNESIYLSFFNSIHMFEKNSPLHNSLNGPILGDKYWDILEQLCIRYLNNKYKTHLTELKMALHCNNLLNGTKRVYYSASYIPNPKLKSQL